MASLILGRLGLLGGDLNSRGEPLRHRRITALEASLILEMASLILGRLGFLGGVLNSRSGVFNSRDGVFNHRGRRFLIRGTALSIRIEPIGVD
jgi:hypothetical protein